MADKEVSNKEITVTTNGVTLKGDIVDDVRPPIQRALKTTDSILRLFDNIVGLPADYLSTQLESFREKYKEKSGQIISENFQEPSFRVGCSVLRHVAYSSDEPELQEIFAKLLATASDKSRAHLVHPSFASVINDITPDEARILCTIGESRRSFNLFTADIEHIARLANISNDVFIVSISNLLRLGLIEKEVKQRPIPKEKLNRVGMGAQFYNPRDLERFFDKIEEAVKNLQQENGELKAIIQEQRLDTGLRISNYGQQFLEACIK